MNRTFDANQERQLQRRGFKLLGVAGGAAVGVLAVMLTAPGAFDGVPSIDDSVPAAAEPATMTAARHGALDEGVDWQHVKAAEAIDGASVAAYEVSGR